jgi:phenylalanyl-tRNA synthetase beta chain
MKISYNWLKELVDIRWSPEATAEKLTLLGFQVESLQKMGVKVQKVIAVQIESIEKHPNADRLQLANIFDGKERKQIVCGAPNIAAGQIVPLAIPGAKLAGGFEIKVSKIRGVESFGMLCSERELGLSDSHQGILILPEKSELGKEVKDIMGGDDVVFEVEITPNRPDALSHVGIARELAALQGKPLKLPTSIWKAGKGEIPCQITIKDTQGCSRYLGKNFSEVKVGPSPAWMVQRLNTCGIRAINNIVDITNYVLLEWGHPLHAFDLEKLGGKEIVVRRAKEGEKIEALDEKTYDLKTSDLIIADNKVPVAIAGVMGGQGTGVTESTTHILLESAVFDRVTVRNTSRRLNLISESSYRFERGTDAQTAADASLRAAQLIMELAQGKPGSAKDAFPRKPKKATVPLRHKRLNQLIGCDIPKVQTEKILKSLGFAPKKSKTGWTCTVPAHRKDILEEYDLVEEVIRLYGYDNPPDTLPSLNPGIIPETQAPLDLVHLTQSLKGLGIHETMTSSFSSLPLCLGFDVKESETIELLNPISQEETIMRPFLVGNLLKAVQRNIYFQRDSVRLFEIGKKFIKNPANQEPIEKTVLSVILYGLSRNTYWKSKSSAVDFFELKGITTLLNENFGSPVQIHTRENLKSFLHPYQCFELYRNGKSVGWGGMFNPVLQHDWDFKFPCAILEWDLERISLPQPTMSPLPRFPMVERDLAILVNKNLSWDKIHQAVTDAEKGILEDAYPFDIFSGGQLDIQKKSVAFRVHLRHREHTLSDAEINSTMDKIKKSLANRCGAEFR